MKIINSELKDIPEILGLYEQARSFQKVKGAVLWPEFDLKLIETEISENRQWKIVIGNEIACVWAITFSDPEIWGDKNADPSLYIHRVATNAKFRGQHFVEKMVDWAREYAKTIAKEFVRMDTVGENKGLIQYYQKCGFEFLGFTRLGAAGTLPAHYHHATVSLFQMSVS